MNRQRERSDGTQNDGLGAVVERDRVQTMCAEAAKNTNVSNCSGSKYVSN